MSLDRDFKGVWIPKEIWLNKELSMLEKGIYTEIASLDNENHCSASNDYFAEFCQCSIATVTRAINHLIELGYIEKISFDGRHRILKVSSIYETNQNDEAASSKCNTNNIYNNINNTKVLSKDNTLSSEDITFNFGSGTKTTKKKNANSSEYDDAILLVASYTDNKELKKELTTLVNMKKEMASKQRYHFYASTIRNYLDELTKEFGDDDKTKIEAVKLSIRYNGTTKVMRPNTSTSYNKNIHDIEGFVTPDIKNDGLNHTKSTREF